MHTKSIDMRNGDHTLGDLVELSTGKKWSSAEEMCSADEVKLDVIHRVQEIAAKWDCDKECRWLSCYSTVAQGRCILKRSRF